MSELNWVIGRGGLLGANVENAIAYECDLWRPPEPISWSKPDGAREELRLLVQRFVSDAGDRPWSVFWCAGAGTVSTSEAILQLELGAFREMLEQLAASPNTARGSLFFASSAGGVYAGVDSPPYDEFSPVRPLSAYGRAKIDAEALVRDWSARTGTPSLIGRIANIYGPGQNINKAQGLISQICRSHLLGRPLSIYVPLDTIRDYFFAPDCAALIVDAMARLREHCAAHGPKAVTKILGSQHAITVGAVLGDIRRIFKNPPRIVVAASSSTSVQVKDLSLKSRVWPELDRRVHTPFPVGVAITWADLQRQLQSAELILSASS